jgi:translation initiation factor IF-3
VIKDILVNEAIRTKMVRIVDETGKQLGVFPLREAIIEARKLDMDVVQISAGEIPVCRITDAGKYMFELKKAQREQAKRQRELHVEIKEIQLRPVTDEHDLHTKARRTKEFLAEGDKVKLVVRFKGRERAHKDQGRKIVDEFLVMVGEHKVDRPLFDGPRDMQMILAPMKSKSELIREKAAK